MRYISDPEWDQERKILDRFRNLGGGVCRYNYGHGADPTENEKIFEIGFREFYYETIMIFDRDRITIRTIADLDLTTIARENGIEPISTGEKTVEIKKLDYNRMTSAIIERSGV